MTILPNPFEFAGCAEHAPANDAAVSSPLPPPDTAAEFPRGFDPEKFFEAIEPPPMFLQAPVDALEILARWA